MENVKELFVTKVRDVKLPQKGHNEDAGFDFFIPNDFEARTLRPHEDILIPSGIRVNVPVGYALVAMNKSGVATKKKLRIGACVIDTGYAGEVHIHLFNDGTDLVQLSPGDKIVQFVLLKIGTPGIKEISNEEYTKMMNSYERGEGGFGSTGVK